MKPLLTFLLVLLGTYCFAQNLPQDKISFNYSHGENDYFIFKPLEGEGSSDGTGFNQYGFSYTRSFKKHFSFEYGLSYSKLGFESRPAAMPGMNVETTDHTMHLISVPVSFRVDFLRFLFVQVGPNLTADVSEASSSMNNQSGIGLQLGIGARYEFKNGVGVFVNPVTKIHSLIPFGVEKYQHHVSESSTMFGISYAFKSKD